MNHQISLSGFWKTCLCAMTFIINLTRSHFDLVSTLHDWVLQGHVFQTLNLTTLGHCVMLCSEIWNCYSLNFYPSQGICELNNAINASHPDDLQYHVNGAYQLNLYRRMPCNDSICDAGKPRNRCFYLKGIAKECIGCSAPLGLGDGTIPDSSFRSSSSLNSPRGDLGFLGRLNMKGNWATSPRPNEWLQVDLGKVVVVTKIATQGSYWSNFKYVKTYFIESGLDGQNWTSYKENGQRKLFVGNIDGKTIVTNTFKEKMLTRFIRVLPQAYRDLFALRMELYGCELP